MCGGIGGGFHHIRPIPKCVQFTNLPSALNSPELSSQVTFHPALHTMFDNSQYPYNCFNYDGDYPTCGTEEEKKVCRPAYRYLG